jgi:hypothetical protein
MAGAIFFVVGFCRRPLLPMARRMTAEWSFAMSPDFLNAARTLNIGLAPECLSAVVRCEGRIAAQSDFHFAADADGGYDGALDCLRHYLNRAGSRLDGVPLSVTVSVRWCQLEMLPWSDALLYADGARRHCEAHFAAIYGEQARSWDYVCDDAPYGQPRLASAFDAGLVAGVRAIAQQCGHALVMVESALSYAGRSLMAVPEQAIAVIEPHRLVLATLVHGRVEAVHAQACIGHWPDYLPDAWHAWRLRAAEPGEIAQLALVSLQREGALHDPADRPAIASGGPGSRLGFSLT